MNKSELVSQIVRQSDISQQDVEFIVNALLNGITKALIDGERVVITRFGSFELIDRAATRRRNPRDGEIINVPPRIAVSFKPSNILLKRIRSKWQSVGVKTQST